MYPFVRPDHFTGWSPSNSSSMDAHAQLEAFEASLAHTATGVGTNGNTIHLINQGARETNFTQHYEPFQVQTIRWAPGGQGPSTLSTPQVPERGYGSVYGIGPIVSLIGNIRECQSPTMGGKVYVTLDGAVYQYLHDAKYHQANLDVRRK